VLAVMMMHFICSCRNKIGAEFHIYLEEGTCHTRLFRASASLAMANKRAYACRGRLSNVVTWQNWRHDCRERALVKSKNGRWHQNAVRRRRCSAPTTGWITSQSVFVATRPSRFLC
jgi:hypothetical protein